MTFKALLMGILVSLGLVNGEPERLTRTMHETVHQGSFTVQEGDTLLQVNSGGDVRTTVRVEQEGSGQRIVINSRSKRA